MLSIKSKAYRMLKTINLVLLKCVYVYEYRNKIFGSKHILL